MSNLSEPSFECRASIASIIASGRSSSRYEARKSVIREWFLEKIEWVLLAKGNNYGFQNSIFPGDWTVHDDTIFKELVAEYAPLLTAAGFIVIGDGERIPNPSRYNFEVSWDPDDDNIDADK